MLGLLLEEFPDVTISKIRFLESQGLIEPERTPSGYRKFYEHDVELLRVILREQRENFLPLRVIKDRIDSGEIERDRHAAARRRRRRAAGVDAERGGDRRPSPAAGRNGSAGGRRRRRPPARRRPAADGRRAAPAADADAADDRARATDAVAAPAAGRRRQPRRAVRDGVGHRAPSSPQLEEYGVVARRKGGSDLYGEDAVEIAAAAGGFLRAGVDARHLRAWRTSVEREVGPVRAARHAAAAPAQPAGPRPGRRASSTSSTRSAPSCAAR